MGCTNATDRDCSTSCGDGVVTGVETCEPKSSDKPCPTQCDDGNVCTRDTLTGDPSQCSAACARVPIGAGVVNNCGGCSKLEHPVGSTCTAGQGACIGTGAYECRGTDGTACNAQPNTAPETCDTRDNDCDGRTDEGVKNTCGGCTKLDHPAGSTCTAGQGACLGTGVYECQSTDSIACNARPNVTPEVCDTRDNDCDGKTDEGVKNTCGGCTKLDYPSGSACTAGRGACIGRGVYECRGTDSTACNAQPNTIPEACNGRDDDCDERIDEGVEKNACGGCGSVPDETCNGRDDDCNKYIDEDCGGRCETSAPPLPNSTDPSRYNCTSADGRRGLCVSQDNCIPTCKSDSDCPQVSCVPWGDVRLCDIGNNSTSCQTDSDCPNGWCIADLKLCYTCASGEVPDLARRQCIRAP